jgi:hypothetical protein
MLPLSKAWKQVSTLDSEQIDQDKDVTHGTKLRALVTGPKKEIAPFPVAFPLHLDTQSNDSRRVDTVERGDKIFNLDLVELVEPKKSEYRDEKSNVEHKVGEIIESVHEHASDHSHFPREYCHCSSHFMFFTKIKDGLLFISE